MTNQDDEDRKTRLERMYTAQDAEELRQLVINQLDLRSGEAVLSIGCGPGFEPAALAEAVGESGHVHGIDIDEETLALAADRCAEMPQVTFEQGDATDLPVADASFDVAVAKQVYQFIDDIEAAVNELHRVLRPCGRAAVVEGDVDAQVIHSSDRNRTKRTAEAVRDARPTPHLGSRLTSYLNDAELTVEYIEPKPTLHTEINERVAQGIQFRREILQADESFDQSEIEVWEQDLRDLDEAGETFMFMPQFVYIAKKSG